MKETLIALLRADQALTEILASKTTGADSRSMVDWMTRPDSGQYPAMTLRSVSIADTKIQKGVGRLVSDRVQMDFWGLSFAEVTFAFRRVKDIFGEVDGVWPSFEDDDVRIDRVLLDNGRDMPVMDAKGGDRVFHYEADFMVWWQYKSN